MRKLIQKASLVFFLLCAMNIFGAGPIFLGTTLDYITNSLGGAGSGTMTFVYSNRIAVFARRDGTLMALTNNTAALELRLTLGRTNGQISIPFSLGDNGGGNDASWVIRGTTNNWGLERRDGTTLLQLQQFASAILDASWLPNGSGSYDLGSSGSRWRTNWLNVLLAATAAGVGTSTPGYAVDAVGSMFVSSNSIFTNLVGNFATNGSANTNLTVNFDQAVEDWYPTNNISLTNFAGLDGGKGKSVVKFITPQLVNRTVVYPTLGGASFGSYWYTNDNSFMWTTLTQGVTYALSLTTRGTNVHASITKWK